jgi:hypothetical protein
VVRENLRDDDGSTFMQGVLFGKIPVPTHPQTTFYTRYGEIFSILCLSLSAIWTTFTLITRLKTKKSACSNPSETKPFAP